MSQDVMICVLNSTAVFDDVNVEMRSSESCVKCLDLDAELLNKQNAYNDLSKRLKCSTSTCRSQPTNNKKNDRISQKPSSNRKNKVKAQPRKVNKKNRIKEPIYDDMVKPTMLNANSQLICVKFETPIPEIKVYSRRPKQIKLVGSSKKAKIVESKIANNSKPNHLWGSNAIDVPSSSSLVNDRLSIFFSACALGKSKKSSHQPKAEDTNQEKLNLLHMDLYGPMRVESINGKKYILVIVDDYSRFT
ncbi:ribonuclease H-like domain-containing protein [Tanacetum coccineum]